MELVQFAFSWQEWSPLHSSSLWNHRLIKNAISKLCKKRRAQAITVLKRASHGLAQPFAEFREREIVVDEENKLSM